MKKLVFIPLMLLIACSCNTFDSGEDLQSEAEEVLPSSTWYAASGDDGYETWVFDSDGTGMFSQHNLPCGSDPVNSHTLEYEIVDGPQLRVELTVNGQTQTDNYDIQGVSEEEVVLLNQQDDRITNLTTNCEEI